MAGESIGAGRWSNARRAGILRAGRQAGEAVVEAIEQASHKPALVVQASGVGAYGPSGNRRLDETAPYGNCLLYTSPSPRDRTRHRMPSFA